MMVEVFSPLAECSPCLEPTSSTQPVEPRSELAEEPEHSFTRSSSAYSTNLQGTHCSDSLEMVSYLLEKFHLAFIGRSSRAAQV